MLIRFTSDGGVVASGFSANYTTAQAPPPVACVNENFTATSGTVSDGSGAANYANNMACQKLVNIPGAASITLTFSDFSTESGKDFVRIYNGPTTAYPLLKSLSGSSLPQPVTSTGGVMLIVFSTDAANTAAGWSASYTSVAGGCASETFTAASGTVSDGPGNYTDNADCQKLIAIVTRPGRITGAIEHKKTRLGAQSRR